MPVIHSEFDSFVVYEPLEGKKLAKRVSFNLGDRPPIHPEPKQVVQAATTSEVCRTYVKLIYHGFCYILFSFFPCALDYQQCNLDPI